MQNESDQATVGLLMRRAEQERDPGFVWESIPAIAGLDERSLIRLRTKLKHEYGPKINLNDFNRLVRAERRKDEVQQIADPEASVCPGPRGRRYGRDVFQRRHDGQRSNQEEWVVPHAAQRWGQPRLSGNPSARRYSSNASRICP